MMFAAEFASVRGIWASFSASAGRSNRRTVDHGPKPIDLVGSLKFGQQRLEQPLPDPGLVPSSETTATRMSRGKIARGGQPSPRYAGSENEEDAIDNSSVLGRLSSGKLNMAILPPPLRDERFESLPKFV
jgi:hypothetical protein